MFNAGARFNRLPFNRPAGKNIGFQAEVECGAVVEASAVRDLFLETQDADAGMELFASMDIEAVFAAIIACGSSVEAELVIEYLIDKLEIYTGGSLISYSQIESFVRAEFAAGVEIVADMTLDVPAVILFTAGTTVSASYAMELAGMAAIECGVTIVIDAGMDRTVETSIGIGAHVFSSFLRDRFLKAAFYTGGMLDGDMTIDKPSVALFHSGSDIGVQIILDHVETADITSGAIAFGTIGIIRGMAAQIEEGAEVTVSISALNLGIETEIETGATFTAEADAHYAMHTLIRTGSRLAVFFEAVTEEVMKAAITLNPGETLVIDTCQYTATINGANIIQSIETQLFDWLQITPNAVELLVDGTIDGDVDVLVNTVPRSL